MRRLFAAALLVLLAFAIARAGDPPPAPKAEAIPTGGDWEARSMKWFTTTGKKAQKREMRKATKALRKPCKHCHLRNWSGYTDRQDISRQMMAMSVEHGVPCKDCHAGKKDVYTELGESSKHWWRVSHELKVFCDHCHVPAKRFEALTKAGKKYAAETKKKPRK